MSEVKLEPTAEEIERVARIVDPQAFDNFEGLRDYCLGRGRTMESALDTATGMHGARRDRALDTALAAILAMDRRAEVVGEPATSKILSVIALWADDEGLELSMGQGSDLADRVRSLVAGATNVWRPISTAPEDTHVILATAGGHVGEALMLIDEDTGQQKWTWPGAPVHPAHIPLGWMPMPPSIDKPVEA